MNKTHMTKCVYVKISRTWRKGLQNDGKMWKFINSSPEHFTPFNGCKGSIILAANCRL